MEALLCWGNLGLCFGNLTSGGNTADAAWKEGIWAVFRLSWYFFLLLGPHLGDLGHLFGLTHVLLACCHFFCFFCVGSIQEADLKYPPTPVLPFGLPFQPVIWLPSQGR